MAVGFKVDFCWFEIGHADFLYSFFSTVAYHLENAKWGTRFPKIMKELYQGKLEYSGIAQAAEELTTIRNELRGYGPEKVIWDMEDLSKQPPWGTRISKDITDLSNYFVTSDGEDFILVLFRALETAKEAKSHIEIR